MDKRFDIMGLVIKRYLQLRQDSLRARDCNLARAGLDFSVRDAAYERSNQYLSHQMNK